MPSSTFCQLTEGVVELRAHSPAEFLFAVTPPSYSQVWMLRPATARLFTTMLLWNCPSNSVAQPTGQPVWGLAMVESPAIQTLVAAAAAAAAAAGFVCTPQSGAVAPAAAGLTADRAVMARLRSRR